MVGEHDIYVTFANHYQWTPDQVDAQDPDVIESLLAHLNAQSEYNTAKAREQERKSKAAQRKKQRR